MAKLIRCPSGHVYDSEAHASCPECARTEVLETESGGAAQGSDGGGGDGGKRGIPAIWLVGGGAAAIAVVASGLLLLLPGQKTNTVEHAPQTSGIPPAVAVANPASDPDFQACVKAVNDQEPCDRAIASGKFNGVPLARLYLIRGFRHTAQQNADAALSDFGEAIKLEPNNAFAMAGLGSIYASKGECTRALEKLGQAISLDPNNIVAYIGRGACLWKQGDLEGARADYQKALSLNPDPATKTSVERVLEVMASAAPPAALATSPPAGDAKPAGTP